MSYPRDLNEYSGFELFAESERRAEWRRMGKCDYCHRDINEEPTCKFADRHAGREEKQR